MIVYELRHEEYAWEDCDTTVTTLIFETENDAIEYLSIKKLDIVSEYCEQLDLADSLEALTSYIDANSYDTYNDLCDEDTYFYVELEEYGHDSLEVIKKEVLKFK